MDVFPEPRWWMPAYPAWLDPHAPASSCVACGRHAVVQHHLYSRRLRPETTPMCRRCEAAVHDREQPRPGTLRRVLDLRSMLPPWAVGEDWALREPNPIERVLVADGTIPAARERLRGWPP